MRLKTIWIISSPYFLECCMGHVHRSHGIETRHLDAACVYRLLGPALEAVRRESPTQAYDVLEKYVEEGILTERQIGKIRRLWPKDNGKDRL